MTRDRAAPTLGARSPRVFDHFRLGMGEHAAFVLFGALNVFAFGLWFGLGRMRRGNRPPRPSEPLDCDARAREPSATRPATFPAGAALLAPVQVALLLLLPWAAAFRTLGPHAPWVAAPVLAALASGLAYAWLRGGFEWE